MAIGLRRRGVRVTLKSALATDGQSGEPYDVLVVDEFGRLRTLYGAADVAYIGASLMPVTAMRGGHNPLEPLAHGIVPLFGPHMRFWESVTQRLRDAWPAIEVDSPHALGERVVQVLHGYAPIADIQRVGETLVEQSRGAIERTAAFLRDHLGLDGATTRVASAEPQPVFVPR